MFRAWFFRREIRTLVKKGKSFGPVYRAMISGEVISFQEFARKTSEGMSSSEKASLYTALMMEATKLRHAALAAGAKNELHPQWFSAAMIEAWTALHILHEEGSLSDKKMIETDKIIALFTVDIYNELP